VALALGSEDVRVTRDPERELVCSFGRHWLAGAGGRCRRRCRTLWWLYAVSCGTRRSQLAAAATNGWSGKCFRR